MCKFHNSLRRDARKNQLHAQSIQSMKFSNCHSHMQRTRLDKHMTQDTTRENWPLGQTLEQKSSHVSSNAPAACIAPCTFAQSSCSLHLSFFIHCQTSVYGRRQISVAEISWRSLSFSMLEAVPARTAAYLYTGLALGHPLGFWLRTG